MLRSKVTRIAPTLGAIPQFLAAAPAPTLAESHPILDELADVAKDAINQQVRGALAGASRYFTARAERTQDERARREYLDALHGLRLSVASVQRAVAVDVERAFTQPPAPSGEPPAITAICDNLWQGLRAQVDALCDKLHVTPFAARLSPESLRSAIRSGVARTDLPARTVTLTQDLLEQGLLSHLDQVYRRVAERLEQYSLPGMTMDFPVAVNQSSATPAAASALHVDPHTKTLLVEISQTRVPEQARKSGYGNAELATELLENLKSERSQGAVPVRARAVVQRLALVGRMFGMIGADARVPEAFKRAFEKLRFPIIKSALVDSNFFTQKSHSLRMLTADLIQKAIAAGDSTHDIEALVRNAAGDFDLSATFVRPALAGLRPLPPTAIERFLADLQDAAAELARLIDDRARDRERAEGLREQLVDLQYAELSEPAVPIVSSERPIERVAAPPVEAEPAPHPLETLFLSAVWFRVYDHKQRKPRWLRLESFYPERDAVAFAEFDGANALSMKASQFLDDLRTGRSAPTNPDDRVRRLLARLQKEKASA